MDGERQQAVGSRLVQSAEDCVMRSEPPEKVLSVKRRKQGKGYISTD